MKIIYAALAACLTLTACIEPNPPAVSDYNGRTVKVQGRIYALNGPGQNIKDYPEYQLAIETCALDGRHEARYQGYRMISDYSGEHVFICA